MKKFRQRKCAECGNKFANPASFYRHKKVTGFCRSDEELEIVGYVETPEGWKYTKPDRMK